MFVFRLESVLNARKAFEDKLLREFSEKKRMLEKETQALEALNEKRRSSIDYVKGIHNRSVTVTEIGLYTSYIGFLKVRMTYQQKMLSKAKDALEEKRRELQEAVKQRKTMENLKEKHRKAYQENLDLQERKVLDEISLQGFSRRSL